MFGRVTRRITAATQFLNFNARSFLPIKPNFFGTKNQNIRTQHVKFRDHHSTSYRTNFDALYSLGIGAGILLPFILQNINEKEAEERVKAWRYFRNNNYTLTLYETREIYIDHDEDYKDRTKIITIEHYNNLLSVFEKIDQLDKLDLDLDQRYFYPGEDKKNRLRELLETFINNKNFKGINEVTIRNINSESDAAIFNELRPKLKINKLTIVSSRYDIWPVKEEASINIDRKLTR